MESDYDGGYAGAFLYTFTEEGTKTFTVEASKAGKKKSVQVTAKYEIGAPTLNVNQSDQTVTDKDFTLSGKATDASDSITLTINGSNVYVDSYNGSWSKSFTLTEGTNTFTIVATNENGKSTTKSVTITYDVGAPTLTVSQGDQSVTKKEFTLSGKATDANYSVTLTINGNNVYVDSYNGSWSKSVTLNEGANTFNIVATNENGKSTTKSVTITLEVSAPSITFINCPESTTQQNLSIIGSVGGDTSGLHLFVNDQEWYLSGNQFNKNVTLKEGSNTFVFRAVNSYGKEVSVTKTITYTAPPAGAGE
jgi:HSP20 family molecular chaperone IbpA